MTKQSWNENSIERERSSLEKKCLQENFKSCPLKHKYSLGRANWDNLTLEETELSQCKKCDREVAYRETRSM